MYERKSERVCERGRERQGGERERDKRNLKGQKSNFIPWRKTILSCLVSDFVTAP